MKTTVINRLIDHKAPFTLYEDERSNYASLLKTLLTDLEKSFITCLDANCIWVGDDAFYSFIFFNNNSNLSDTLLYNQLKIFVSDFTDNDGKVISITRIKDNTYQLNFIIS